MSFDSQEVPVESPTKATVNETPKQGGSNQRSTIEFPYSDLNSAVEIVRGVHSVGGTACEYDQLAAHLGLEAKGGGFRIRVTAAKTYGLLTYERGGRITLTELGRQIIDKQHERAARVEAFLKVPLFAKVFENFKGSQLPPQAGLERAIISYGVGAKVVRYARQVLMRSAKQGGFFQLSQDRLTAPPIHGGSSTEQQQQRKDAEPRRGSGSGNGGDEGEQHPLIHGLLITLPKPPAAWSTIERMNWLVMANSIFKNIYPNEDDDEIDIKLNRGKKTEADDLAK